MPDQALIGTKETVSEEDFLQYARLIQMENTIVQNSQIPDKFQICQFLARWAESTDSPVEDLFYIMQRTRETIKLQLAKKEQDANQICFDTLGECINE